MTHVSPSDVYGYLSWAKRENVIGGFERMRVRGRVLWRIETVATRYDAHNGIPWAPIVLSSREACAFIEGVWAGRGQNPTTRPGAYRAPWSANHVSPSPLGVDL